MECRPRNCDGRVRGCSHTRVAPTRGLLTHAGRPHTRVAPTRGLVRHALGRAWPAISESGAPVSSTRSAAAPPNRRCRRALADAGTRSGRARRGVSAGWAPVAETSLRLAADDPDRAERERRAIIRAAHRLIGREGRATTPLEDILRGAGVNRRTFYRHFPSKDALILTMQREAAAGVRDSLRAVVRQAGDAR
ncbi:TetR/AcrR family transcriptional regulator, partial [Frankia sp. CpI1-P]|uniref:TetR/AcrR family transcriptional regulator n=1 Tax=Frankia sp. CpI1-P TaxID=1502734 RepID=UPI001F5B885F